MSKRNFLEVSEKVAEFGLDLRELVEGMTFSAVWLTQN